MEGGKAHGSSRHLSFLGFVQTNTRFHIEDQSDTKTTIEEDNGGICSLFSCMKSIWSHMYPNNRNEFISFEEKNNGSVQQPIQHSQMDPLLMQNLMHWINKDTLPTFLGFSSMPVEKGDIWRQEAVPWRWGRSGLMGRVWRGGQGGGVVVIQDPLLQHEDGNYELW